MFWSFENMKEYTEDIRFKIKVAKSCCDAFSSIFMYPIHVLDFYNDEFLYISDTREFVGGYTPEDIRGKGWKFFLETCVGSEQDLIRKAIKFLDDFYSKLPVEKKKDYSVSFNYTIKLKNANMGMVMNHQLVPLYIDSQNRAAVFLGAFFPGSNAQKRVMVLRNMKESRRWAYNPKADCLENFSEVQLTLAEKRMLLCVCSGMTTNMMVSVLNKSADTINGYRKSVIAKLGVQNMQEAIAMAMIHKLL